MLSVRDCRPYGQLSSNLTAVSSTGCPSRAVPAAGVWEQTCQLDSINTIRSSADASFTVIDVLESRAPRAAFTDSP